MTLANSRRLLALRCRFGRICAAAIWLTAAAITAFVLVNHIAWSAT